MLNTQGYSLYNLLSDQKLGADVVTFTLSMWLETTRDPPPDPYHKLVLFKSIFRTHLHGLYNEFHSVKSDLYLLTFFLKEISVIIVVHTVLS